MPIYEYKCPNCGVFEVTQRITEDPLSECPTCAAEVSRLISHTSFVLKGGGWYATDYARSKEAAKGDGAESSGKTEGGGDAAKNSGSASSSDSSAAASSETKSASDKSGSSKAAD